MVCFKRHDQQVGKLLEVYLQKLKQLGAGCNFLAVSAKLHKEKAIRDAFVSGIWSNEIRRRLFKDHNFCLQNAFYKARLLEITQTICSIECLLKVERDECLSSTRTAFF